MENKLKIKNKRTKRRRAGFTLVELLVSMAIMLLFTIIMSSLMTVATTAYKKAINCSNADVFLSNMLNQLRLELTDARNVEYVTQAAFQKQGNTEAKYTITTGGHTVKSGIVYTDAATGAEGLIFISSDEPSTLYLSKYGEVNELVTTTDDITLTVGQIIVNTKTVVFQNISASKDGETYSSVSEATVKLK